MDIGNTPDLAQTLHPVHDSRDRGWRQILTPQDAENVFAVVVISWIFAAVALVCIGKFNLILLLVAVGFVTVLVVLSSVLSLLTTIALQKLLSWFKYRCSHL
jgi:hypothetical protein